VLQNKVLDILVTERKAPLKNGEEIVGSSDDIRIQAPLSERRGYDPHTHVSMSSGKSRIELKRDLSDGVVCTLDRASGNRALFPLLRRASMFGSRSV